MTRMLEVVDARDPVAVLQRLRDALTGDGPAVLPRSVDGVEAGSAATPLPATVPQNVALVIETSGSMGRPKRVALSSDAVLASAAASTSALGAPGQWLLALPAQYIAGAQVLVRSLAAGTEPAILPLGHFDPREFTAAASTMSADLARYVSLVPVQLSRLMNAAESDSSVLTALQRFDGILVGGQALGEALYSRALDHGLRVVRTYGATETCGGCIYDGKPIGQVRVRTVAAELEIAGPVLAEGYVGDPLRSDATFHTDEGTRWYRTGDLGSVEAGVVRVTGRADNVIISGGVKVSLDAVERSVRALPEFAESVVVGADDAEWGEVPVVAVPGVERMPAVLPPTLVPVLVSPPSGGEALAQLRAHVAAALGPAAQPSRIVTISAMPLLASGKPDRAAVARLISGSRG